MKAMLQQIWGRLSFIFMGVSVEVTEVINLFCCGAWFVPIVVRDDYLKSSIYLRSIESVWPRHFLIWLFGCMGFIQLTAVIWGGRVSGSPPVQTDIRALLPARMLVSAVLAFFWFTISVLQNKAGFGTGTIIWAGIGSLSIFGVWRLRLRLSTDARAEGIREQGRFVKTDEAADISSYVAEKAGPRSELIPIARRNTEGV